MTTDRIERADYSPIIHRKPVKLPDGARLGVWFIINVEKWDINATMARAVLPAPQGVTVIPDIPNGLQPPLDPETKQPMAPEKLAAVFPMGLLEQEMSPNSWIDIPEEVQDIYKIWRPSPLVRANKLEEALGTKAKIFFKKP